MCSSDLFAFRPADETCLARGRPPCANFTPSCSLGKHFPAVRVAVPHDPRGAYTSRCAEFWALGTPQFSHLVLRSVDQPGEPFVIGAGMARELLIRAGETGRARGPVAWFARCGRGPGGCPATPGPVADTPVRRRLRHTRPVGTSGRIRPGAPDLPILDVT